MLLREFREPLRGCLARHRQHLRREQGQDDPVLVRGPHAAVTAEERRAGGLLPTERDSAGLQPVDEPLEAHRHLVQLTAVSCDDTVDERGAHQRLADPGVERPVGAMLQQVVDRDGQVVVGVHEARVGGDDAVAVRVSIVPGGDVEGIAGRDEGRHRVGR